MTRSRNVCLITGSSRGLGRALAKHFLEKGYTVLGSSRGKSTISHTRYFHEQINLQNEDEVKIWLRKIKKMHLAVDVLICNLGLARSAMLFPVTPTSVYRDFIETNISSLFFVMREVSKMMLSKKSGRIITISSTMVASHQEGTAIYSASKAAITEMTKVVAKELAPQGITCNIIAPAMLDTEASEELSKAEHWREKMLALQTFPRVIEMAEVCHAADFFVSDLAKSISGQVLYLGLVN